MSRIVICPTVTATDTHEYREQMERLIPFATRVHIDLMDGHFAPTVSPTLKHVWWPEGIVADIHLMYTRPSEQLDMLIQLKPHLVIVPAEAEDDVAACLASLQTHGVAGGVALLPDTDVQEVANIVKIADQVLIFSGKLGYHGGVADVSLLRKVADIRAINKTAEIAWDGGITDVNATTLVQAGIEVLNVGGFIQRAPDPQAAYAILTEQVRGSA